jgi:membrane protein DedA with SNARE-associated domain
MHEVHQFIHQYGDLFYLFVFAWTVLEGETFVIFAGFFAQKGAVNVWLLFLAAWLGSLTGDQICFLIGRSFGTRILDHLPKLKPGVERALGWLERYAVAFILTYRFMYGLRNVSGVAVGLSHLPWKKFAIWNAIAAFAWALAFVGFGYLFGDVVGHMHHKEVVEENVRQVMMTALGLFLMLIGAKLAFMRIQRLRRQNSHKKT